jgi:hypothetical protein
LWLDRRQWREMGPVEACTIVVHEWGHLLGLGHSEDPLDLMADFPARPPYRCARLGRKVRAARASARDRLRCEVRAKRAGGTKRPRSAKRPRFACITRG